MRDPTKSRRLRAAEAAQPEGTIFEPVSPGYRPPCLDALAPERWAERTIAAARPQMADADAMQRWVRAERQNRVRDQKMQTSRQPRVAAVQTDQQGASEYANFRVDDEFTTLYERGTLRALDGDEIDRYRAGRLLQFDLLAAQGSNLGAMRFIWVDGGAPGDGGLVRRVAAQQRLSGAFVGMGQNEYRWSLLTSMLLEGFSINDMIRELKRDRKTLRRYILESLDALIEHYGERIHTVAAPRLDEKRRPMKIADAEAVRTVEDRKVYWHCGACKGVVLGPLPLHQSVNARRQCVTCGAMNDISEAAA